MIDQTEARSFVLGACAPLTPRRLPLADAAGCVLAEAVVSGEAVPPFANTAMDGFAVRAADTAGASDEHPARLRIVGTLLAGAAPDVVVGPGEAVRIMTGAPMPDGADAVVMVERTAVPPGPDGGPGDVVEASVAVEVGQHVRPAGDDVRVGDAVFAPGIALSPGHIGVLATIGVVEPLVVPRPVVGVLSTGDELVDGGGPLGPGQIRDSNRAALLALVAERGCVGVDLGRAPDDEAAITAAIERGVAACDAVITSGGVSMGDVDLVKVVLDRLGVMRWMQVAIRPAKPLAFGTVARADGRRVPVFGLPGNPVSSLVSFELFAGPGLRRLAGHPDDRLDRPRLRAVADAPLRRRPDGKTHFPRVVARWDPGDGRLHVAAAGAQGSHQLTAMAHADGLAVLPDGDGVDVGGDVEVLLLADPPVAGLDGGRAAGAGADAPARP